MSARPFRWSRLTRDAVIRTYRERLWFGPAAAGAFAVAVSTMAYWAGRAFDGRVGLEIGRSELLSLLGIFATSMLTVATFTIAAIVTSASSVRSSTTPRATKLVLSDARGQAVLSAFIAAFIYSVVGLLALQALDYRPFGRFVLFIGLIVIVIIVLIAFIGWIDRVLKLGRQETMIARLRSAAEASITHDAVGTFGAHRWDGTPPAGSRAVRLDLTGFVAAVRAGELQQAAERFEVDLVLAVRPGELIEPTIPVAYVRPHRPLGTAGEAAELDDRIAGALDVSPTREFEDDIRFNLVNLGETADRALSPAVNDPGTAINVLFTLLCVFERWVELVQDPQTHTVRYDRVALPPLTAEEMVDDAFTPIVRDGAGIVEVGIRLHKTLQTLGRLGVPELTVATRRMASIALEQSDHALVVEAHRERLRSLADQGHQP